MKILYSKYCIENIVLKYCLQDVISQLISLKVESSTDSDFDEEEEDTDSVESDRLYENIVNRSKTIVKGGNSGLGGPQYDEKGNGGGPLYDGEGNGGNVGGPLYENMEALTLENPSLRRRPRSTRRCDYNFLILTIFTIQARPTIK